MAHDRHRGVDGRGFYCSILVARGLGPDFMGQYNYILYFATVLKLVSDLALSVTVRKFAAEFIGQEDYGLVRTLVRARCGSRPSWPRSG